MRRREKTNRQQQHPSAWYGRPFRLFSHCYCYISASAIIATRKKVYKRTTRLLANANTHRHLSGRRSANPIFSRTRIFSPHAAHTMQVSSGIRILVRPTAKTPSIWHRQLVYIHQHNQGKVSWTTGCCLGIVCTLKKQQQHHHQQQQRRDDGVVPGDQVREV